MHFDDALGDRETEAGPALLAGDRAVGLLEFLEDLGLISGGNTGPCIADCDGERSVARLGADRHLTLVGELDRVADQVEQDLREPPSVPVTGRQVRRDLRLENQLLLGSKRFDRGHDTVHHVR